MDDLANKKEILKKLVKKLHQGEKAEEIKERFREVFKNVSPQEIAQVEEELIKEGMPAEEIKRFCDVHIAMFRESLDQAGTIAPPGQPIHILMEEHKILLRYAEDFAATTKRIKSENKSESSTDQIRNLNRIAGHFKDSENHYLREENILFPYLEKHGITQPPAMMWMEHNQIREIKKNIYKILEGYANIPFKDFAYRLNEPAMALAELLASHFYKENNILFPTGLKVITPDEFNEIRQQFDEIGYCCFTPESAKVGREKMQASVSMPHAKGMISLETGDLSPEEIERIFNTLPVDVTFVDKDDRVRYFSQTEERIFVRTKAVIGLKVQQCHPQKSLHMVTQILDDFKKGKKNQADFWINLQGKMVYIRYFAVRNKKKEYLGCLEVTQDIAPLKKIEGEKRLL
jgi:DUF438 domain-containing protein